MYSFKSINEVIFLIYPDTRSAQDRSLCEVYHRLKKNSRKIEKNDYLKHLYYLQYIDWSPWAIALP